jgi:uncharacterized protein (TIGR03435 family)
MRQRIICTVLFLLAGRPSDADNKPQFEIATLKSTVPPGDSYSINLGTIRGDTLGLNYVTLSDCIKFAYGLVSDDQEVGPDWIKSKTTLFEIVAQVPPATSREQVQLMTQSLLADRLKLTLHHQQKTLRYLALAKTSRKQLESETRQWQQTTGIVARFLTLRGEG